MPFITLCCFQIIIYVINVNTSRLIRYATTLWPNEISCVFTNNEFHAIKFPTIEEALFAKFKKLNDSLQTVPERQSTLREAALKTVTEIMK